MIPHWVLSLYFDMKATAILVWSDIKVTRKLMFLPKNDYASKLLSDGRSIQGEIVNEETAKCVQVANTFNFKSKILGT